MNDFSLPLVMPTVSLAVMSIAMGLPTAIQIVVVPTVVTNVWQALIGDGLRRLVRERCDFLVYLPMRGRVESLNAATAGAPDMPPNRA